MSHILHISDTHFGTEQAEVVAALQEHVRTQGADLLVLSGDITQRARRGQFAAARAFVDSLAIERRLVIPGNHDLPLYNVAQRFLSPYGNYRRAFGDELEPLHEDDELLLIGLNTTDPRRHKDGLVSAAQVHRVCELLAASDPAKLRIVVAHQPFGSMEISDLSNLQHGAMAALGRWAHAGLDLVMGGHIHLPYVLPLSQQYPSLAREIWIVQAGTTLSSRVRGTSPNSFNRIHFQAGGDKRVQVERWDYIDGAFVAAAHFELGWPPA